MTMPKKVELASKKRQNKANNPQIIPNPNLKTTKPQLKVKIIHNIVATPTSLTRIRRLKMLKMKTARMKRTKILTMTIF